MAMQARQVIRVHNPFSRSRELFEQLCGRLERADAFAMTHTEL
jgi:hypothetical protein